MHAWHEPGCFRPGDDRTGRSTSSSEDGCPHGALKWVDGTRSEERGVTDSKGPALVTPLWLCALPRSPGVNSPGRGRKSAVARRSSLLTPSSSLVAPRRHRFRGVTKARPILDLNQTSYERAQ